MWLSYDVNRLQGLQLGGGPVRDVRVRPPQLPAQVSVARPSTGFAGHAMTLSMSRRVCTNLPAEHAYYTGPGASTPDSCPWDCAPGYSRTGASTCTPCTLPDSFNASRHAFWAGCSWSPSLRFLLDNAKKVDAGHEQGLQARLLSIRGRQHDVPPVRGPVPRRLGRTRPSPRARLLKHLQAPGLAFTSLWPRRPHDPRRGLALPAQYCPLRLQPLGGGGLRRRDPAGQPTALPNTSSL